MKKILLLVFSLGVIAGMAQAQTDPAHSYPIPTNSLRGAFSGGSANFQPTVPSGGAMPFIQSSADIAEAITPEIQTLADNLADDPTAIFNFVHDHIRYVHYFGSKKGAALTLWERSGNDFDQCALLVSLLEAAGYAPGYQFGLMKIPYDAANHKDLHHWFGLSLLNTNWSNTENFMSYFAGERGFATLFDFSGDTNNFAFQHVWVTLSLGGTNFYLDPSFKVSEPIAGINLASAMGLNTTTLLSAAAGTATSTSVTGLNESALRSALQTCNTTFLTYLTNNMPNASVQQVIGGQQIVSSSGLPLSTALLFGTFTNATYPILNWTSQPTNFMATFTISVGGTNKSWLAPQLEGQRIALTFSNTGLAQLWLEDTQLFQTSNTGSGSQVNVILTATHPYGAWDTANNVPIDTGYFDQTTTNAYLRTNSTYAITYGFEASPQLLQSRQQKLDAYQQQGLLSTSREVTTETLNVMGLSWLLQTELTEELLSREWGQLPQFHHRFGRMAQEKNLGYYVDVYMQSVGTFPSTGYNAPDIVKYDQVFDVGGYIGSAMEHGVIEQLQSSNLVGASTVKMLEIASTNSQVVYLATSANWTTVSAALTHYKSSTLSTLSSLISSGYTLLLPANGSNHVAGSTSWAGAGYVKFLLSGTFRSQVLTIDGNYHGGYVSDPTASINYPYVTQSGDGTFNFFNATPVSLPITFGADPINMEDGTFQTSGSDLSLGQVEPRGISLNRYYTSERRNNNPVGMASGWLHNYYFNLISLSAPQSGLGITTPQQMSSMIVAACAALNIYNATTPDPKNWMVTALISKWGVDQLINNAVSVSMGRDTVEFIKQPDGTFTPPPGNTMTLSKSGSAYNLSQRHGNTFNFDANNRLANIVDQYGQVLALTYNSSNWVSTVTDWKGRSLSFTYSGTPLHLTSVSNVGTGRVISYGYTANANGQLDLTSVTDAEGKTSTFSYDANHQIINVFDALSQLVVSNNYDGFGRIITQYTQGDPAKLWEVFCTGFQTTVLDPAGGQQDYFYDDKSRLTGYQDALGNLTQSFYDGQDHVVMTISPLNETNQFQFDAYNNLVATVDPLGFTNKLFYDANFNAIRTVNARGNTNSFGYNSKFQMVTSTNAMGDASTNAYDSTYGLLSSRSDAGGTTTYAYDSLGQLTNITFPGTLGTNSFANNSYGDVVTSVNARGFTNTFLYNNRRQLTQTTAPTNLITKLVYDAVGNVITNIDPRSNPIAYTWSPTRHLLTTKFPNTALVTNTYDARDWLVRTLDPMSQSRSNVYDLAGRLTRAIDPVLRTNNFGYDDDGRQTFSTNQAGEIVAQQWNVRGQLTDTVDQLGKNILKSYDANGNLILLTNRNGYFWQFHYDAANRLTNMMTPLGKSNYLVWNNRGLLATNKDFMGQSTMFGYDALGRMNSRTDSLATATFIYDGNGNLATNSEGGQSLVRQFDAYDRLSSYTDAAGHQIKYNYDASGNLTTLTYPGNRTVTYAYDNLNRLTTITDWASRQTTYTYDLNSRVTSITRPNGTVRSNFYDGAGELINLMEQTASHGPIAFYRLSYNSAAHMQYEFAAPTPIAYTPAIRMLGYDADNRMNSFNSQTIVNDNNGNMTSGPLLNGTLTTYAYDARNRLLSAGGISYGYDPANNRVALTNGATTNGFTVDPKTSQVLIRVKGTTTNYYVYGLGLVYEEDDTPTTTNTLSYHFDSRGSTVALSDSNGNVTDRVQYSAYGSTTLRIGTNETPFLFNGQYGVQTDPNGLLCMRARFYNPYICRFINADPSGFSGGLNFYAYANGDPISMIDPFGLDAIVDKTPITDWLYNNVFTPVFETYPNQIGAQFDAAENIHSGWTTPMNAVSAVVTTTVFDALSLVNSGLNTVGLDPETLAAAGPLFGPEAMLSEALAELSAGKIIGLGLDEDLLNLRGSGALTYKNGGWQAAGLTTVDWGRAAVDNSWFQRSFREAAENASAIRFDVSSFSTTYGSPGMTTWELNQVLSNPALLGKTTFVRNGVQVIWNGSTFVIR